MSHVTITGCETAILNNGQELHLDNVQADGPIVYQNGASGSVVDTELTGRLGLVSRDSEVTSRRVTHRPATDE